MEFFFHFTCLLLLPYFLVKLFSIINNSLFSFLFSRHIPSLLVICKPCMTRFLRRLMMKYISSICFKSGTFAFFPSFRRQKHDARMLAVSQLYDDLQNFAFDPIGRAMCLFGDPAYLLRVHLQASFRVGILTRDMEMFNESMSAVRSSV